MDNIRYNKSLTQLKQTFSSEVIKESIQFIDESNNILEGDHERIDLTNLKTYAIDDDDSYEIDDAISLESSAFGIKIWIHIADPCRLIPKNSFLDNEAMKRGNSLYLVDKMIPMIPYDLSDTALSLKPGIKRAAISASIKLDNDGAILESQITRSWIITNYSLSYNDADELIELDPPGDKDLRLINELLARRRKWRVANGAIILEQTRGRFYKNRDGKTNIKIINETNSRRMVSEAMILMGTVVADFGVKNNIPLPYKTQQASLNLLHGQTKQISNTPVTNASIKFSLKRSRIESNPSEHSTLGLKAYVQVTSPIRRYIDLIVHRQLLAFMNGQRIQTALELSEQLNCLETVIRESTSITREEQKKYLILWLKNNPNDFISCQFLRWMSFTRKLALLLFEEIAIELICTLETDDDLDPGSIFRIQLISSDELTGDVLVCKVNNR